MNVALVEFEGDGAADEADAAEGAGVEKSRCRTAIASLRHLRLCINPVQPRC